MITVRRCTSLPIIKKLLPCFFALIAIAQQGHGQILLQWNTSGNMGTELTEPSIFNNVNLATTNLTLGTITPATNNNRFGGSGWFKAGNTNPSTLAEAIAGNSYIQFIVTPNAGASFTPTSFDFIWDRTASTGPTSVALRSSADGYAANLGNAVTGIVSGAFATNSISISGLTNLTVATTFRVYGYGATAATGTGGFDAATNASPVNVQLNGTAACGTPSVYSVTGGGNYCSGGAGVSVGLSGSESSVSYQLYNGASTAGSAITGTGSAFTFGLQTVPGNYTVVATRTLGSCTVAMNNSATVAYNTADINVQGFGNNIPDGTTTTSSSSLSNFNSVHTGGNATRTFTIQNLGATSLGISGTSVTGANASDFTVSAAPASSVSAGGSTTFTVKFTPGGTGTRAATIHIANSDCDEADYDFAVEGTGRSYTDLYVDAAATGSNDGTSWANAFTDFQSALSTTSAGDIVYVAQGTYKPSIGIAPSPQPRTNTFTLSDGVTYYGGFPTGGGAGTLASRNFSTYRTILSGDIGATTVSSDNCFTVVNADNLGTATTLNGFTIEAGRADSSGSYTMYGRSGGIYLGASGAMQLVSVTVRNTYGANGAGIYAEGPVNWSVQACTFDNLTNGGAIYIGGIGSSGTFTNCSFSNNLGFNGGAICLNVISATFSFTSCSFNGNTGNYSGGGGAINAGAAACTFTACSFTNNTSIGPGGAFDKTYATVNTFSYCTFSGNSARDGGALCSYSGGLNVDHCIFTQNFATGSSSTYASYGGAIDGSGTITNTVFRNNYTQYGTGGAIYNNVGGQALSLTNCTFTGNNAGFSSVGGGVNNNSSSSAVVSNCIFWNNTANGSHSNPDAEIVYYSGSLSVTNTIWQGNNTGGTIYNADPRFTNAATGDLSLQDCSPAIDAGAANSLTDDAAGNPRPVDNFPGGLKNDLGAYEKQTFPSPPEINVQGNGNNIVDGGNTPAPVNFTNFNSVRAGTTFARTFTIQNAGPGSLSITGASVTGANASEFVVTAAPASSVAASGSTTFVVTFTSTATGNRTATIHIANSDCDEGDYDFAVQGTGTPATDIYVDLSATGNNNGASWADAYTDFQGALNIATSGKTVYVAQGTYKPSIGIAPSPQPRTNTFTLSNGVVYYGGFPAGGGIMSSRNFSTYRTILSGDIGTANVSTDNCFVVVNAAGLGTSTVFNGFTVENARPDSTGYTMYGQGAVHLGSNGAMQLLNVTVRNNNNAYACAGVYAGGPANWTVSNCTFDNNTPSTGLYIGGYASGAITNCVFSNNSGYNGGGVGMNTVTSSFSFTNCSFTGNHATQYAGAIAAAEGTTFTDCSFSNNTAVEGGAIWSFYGVHTFTRCTFNQNSATGDGGVIRIPGFTGGATFSRCVFTNNSSATGTGGAVNISNRDATLSNCVFWNNTATGYVGGAIYNNGGTMTITNCSFNKNSCGSSVGGALDNNSGSSVVSNCIFWGNLAGNNDGPATSEIASYGSGVSVTNSIWQGNTTGGSIYNADPVFTNSTTGDLTLQDCSAAIDAGAANSLTTDIIGNPKPIDNFPGGGTYDIGAYEKQTFPILPEINVRGNSTDIVDGASSTSATNNTDFGTGPQSRTFTIQNTGGAALSITGVSITGANASDFSVTTAPANSLVATTGTTTFTVAFNPAVGGGTRTATIHIANNDCDEGDYDFAVQGLSCTLPAITSISPQAAKPGTTVVISGSNFDVTAANNIVYFGAARATVTAANATSLSVTIPAGATYDLVSVTAGSCSLTAYSKTFDPTYCGNQTVSAASFTDRTSFATYDRPYGVAIGDLDGDGKNDMAVANYYPSYFLSVFKNTATSGGLSSSSFGARQNFAAKQQPYYVLIQDMDGDGKQDVIVASQGSGGSVYPNTTTGGTISFGTRYDLPTGAYSVAIGDLDGDGRPDLVFSGGGTYIYRNTSTPGNVSFASVVTLSATPVHIALSDLDGDGKAEIIGTIYGSNQLAIYQNSCTPGNISASNFTAITPVATQTNPYGLTVADFDGDGKTDLAVVCRATGNIQVFKNNSTGTGNFGWASPVVLSGGYSILAADLTGDGKPDIIRGGASISVYVNNASPGSLSAADFGSQISVSNQNAYGNDLRQIVLGDLDGDGKPDLASTNDGDNTGGRPPGYVWVSRNVILTAIPTISASGPTTFCSGGSVQLTANNGFSSYTWSNTATGQAITVSATGNYSVTGQSANGCSATSAPTTVTVNPNPSASISGTTTICAAGSTNISFSGTPNATVTYHVNAGGNQTILLDGTGSAIFSASPSSDATYTPTLVTSAANCSTAISGQSAIVTVNPVPNAVASPASQTTCGAGITPIVLSSNVSSTVYNWARTNTATIGGSIAGSGNANPISGSLTNTTGMAATTVFTITPSYTNAGKTCTGTATSSQVTVPSVLNASLGVSPLYPMSGQEIQTIYLNYTSSAQSEDIILSPSGGNGNNSYAWTRSNCNGATMAPLSGATSTTGTYTWAPGSGDICSGNGDNIYTFTITVSDGNGCTASATKKLNVVDPYVSGGNVQICHKVAVRGGSSTQLLSVAPSTVATHLAHGDYLGNCTVFTGTKLLLPEVSEEQHVTVYPNPTTGVFVLELSSIRQEASIMVTDVAGKLITTRSIAKDAPPTATFDLSNLARGIYLIQVRDGDLAYRTKIVVQ